MENSNRRVVMTRRDQAKGEGSRGGKIVGHTFTGKPIYESHGHSAHRELSSGEHGHAWQLLRGKAEDANARANRSKSLKAKEQHHAKADKHLAEAEKHLAEGKKKAKEASKTGGSRHEARKKRLGDLSYSGLVNAVVKASKGKIDKAKLKERPREWLEAHAAEKAGKQ